ncbi:hypothetical protein KUV80_01485 [Fictibacillus nanhaiensis]|uniref:hypothetical protein n=1 Tax=Fictibacillus nanhaiensis TaxID=742169 RepID=UPI001C95FF7D|nr:hypothetical protein [Fictibacillus nanhaiensis]MBY6035305.1 hypothetical protein [Fictibacillus nanhaiensis]
MGLINLLENEYDLYGVEWKQEPHLIMTDFGEKRLRYWTDEERLKWHMKWRDESAKGSGAVPDRMIRTRDGEIAVFDGKHWISLHDSADTPFGCEEVERWGQFIGHLLLASIKASHENHECKVTESVFDFDSCLAQSEKYMEGNFKCINTSIYEARQRLKFAEALKRKVRKPVLPILEKDISISNGKRIFHFLFYQGGDSWPEKGYLPIRKFLFEWLSHTSPLSLRMLLTEVNKVFPLNGEHGLLLLAEITVPWELRDCLILLDNENLEKMIEGMQKYEATWEEHRIFLKTVTQWFDENRRKVAL